MLCITNIWNKHQSFVYSELNDRIVLFHTLQFNISRLFATQAVLFLLFDRILSGAKTLDQSGPGSNGNKEVLHIPQSSRTGALPSDCLMSYPEHMLRGGMSYLCRDAVGIFYSPSRLGLNYCCHIRKKKQKTFKLHNQILIRNFYFFYF